MGENIKPQSWQNHGAIRAVDGNGFFVTKDGGKLAPDVPLANISPDAVIKGNTLLEGDKSFVGAGAVIDNSYCKDVRFEEDAIISDSVIVSTGNPRSHKFDGVDEYVVSGQDGYIGMGSKVCHCHLTDTAVAQACCLDNSVIHDCSIGPANNVSMAKMDLVDSEVGVIIDGPTEVSEARLGRNTCIHRQGYFEGIFSNEFFVLAFDEDSGALTVKEVIDLPHVSEYGTNTINSTNSGRLLPQPDGVLKNLGPQVELWHDRLLSHEAITLGPCCWVTGWTKVVGQAKEYCAEPEVMVKDPLATYLMPFSVAGYGADQTSGLVAPGELSRGYGHKLRCGAWIFTHCPDAVMDMVARLYEALDDDEKHKADMVVATSLENALCLLKYMASELGYDLSKPRQEQRGGKAKWFVDYKNVLEAHIDSKIWKFENGKPAGWQHNGEKWSHEKLAEIQELFLRDDEEVNISTQQLIECQHETPKLEIAVTDEELAATIDESVQIGPDVEVAPGAYIGPGCVLKGKTTIGRGAWLFRTIVENSTVGENTRLERCLITAQLGSTCSIGADVKFSGCKVVDSQVGDGSSGSGASVLNSTLAVGTVLSALAKADNVQTTEVGIIGCPMTDTKIDTVLMCMHSAGYVSGMIAQKVSVNVDGRNVEIPAIPMLGGGCQIRGTRENPVVLEGAFIGSNTIIYAGSFVGFGCFVLGQLGGHEGLLPFTLSTSGRTERAEIGAVLTRFPGIVVTHFISWAYQAMEPDRASDIIYLVNGSIARGFEALRWELDRRKDGRSWDESGPYAQYKSMALYSEEQLTEGVRIYSSCLEAGSWDLEFDGENLFFANRNGCWVEKNGYIRWQQTT